MSSSSSTPTAQPKSLGDVLRSFGDDKRNYLYVLLKKDMKISAFGVIDFFVQKGLHKKNPSLRFHPLPHALHVSGHTETLERLESTFKNITINNINLSMFWSRPQRVKRPPTVVYRLRIEGIETIYELQQLSAALGVPVVEEKYNGITLGSYLATVYSLSEDLIKAFNSRGCKVSINPINFCKKCLLHYTSKPSL
eukprot:TRINITY_DN977_c0_g2_i7.p1 TRINITY_DN977_c0_g2~~TRINITY_DN977_c0_g2_i7.p1  ORF type:complete len:195 (+),score=35.55 TRINITY_DN977_c0_g2_i7:281-865(+)